MQQRNGQTKRTSLTSLNVTKRCLSFVEIRRYKQGAKKGGYLVNFVEKESNGVRVGSIALLEHNRELIDGSQLVPDEASLRRDHGKSTRQVEVLGGELGQPGHARSRLGRLQQIVLVRGRSYARQRRHDLLHGPHATVYVEQGLGLLERRVQQEQVAVEQEYRVGLLGLAAHHERDAVVRVEVGDRAARLVRLVEVHVGWQTHVNELKCRRRDI